MTRFCAFCVCPLWFSTSSFYLSMYLSTRELKINTPPLRGVFYFLPFGVYFLTDLKIWNLWGVYFYHWGVYFLMGCLFFSLGCLFFDGVFIFITGVFILISGVFIFKWDRSTPKNQHLRQKLVFLGAPAAQNIVLHNVYFPFKLCGKLDD